MRKELDKLIELGIKLPYIPFPIKTNKKLEKIKELKLYINENLNSKNLDEKYKIIKSFLYPNFFQDQNSIDKSREEFSQSLDYLTKENNIQLTLDKDTIDPPIFNLSYDQYENLKFNKKIVDLYRKF